MQTNKLDAFLDHTTDSERRVYFAWREASGKRAQQIFKLHSIVILKVQALRVKLGLSI